VAETLGEVCSCGRELCWRQLGLKPRKLYLLHVLWLVRILFEQTSYVGCVHKHRFWLWSRKIPPRCTVRCVFYRENAHREYITRRGKTNIAPHIWAESFWIILNQNRCLYTQPTYMKAPKNWQLSQLVIDVLMYNTKKVTKNSQPRRLMVSVL
jgi:hypothetical protein